MQKRYLWVAPLVFASGAVFAQSSGTSVVDYANIASEVTDQFGAALTAAAVLVGLIMGAKIGWSFVKRMLGS